MRLIKYFLAVASRILTAKEPPMAAERKLTSTNYRNQSFLEEKCSLNELLDFVSKRWVCDVLFCIEEGTNRFKTIKEELVYISDTILADRLKLLERYGLISKTYFEEVPPRVEYALTENGIELSNLLEIMCKFSERIVENNEALRC